MAIWGYNRWKIPIFTFFLLFFLCVLGGMFTANTMSSVVETLGLTLPGM